MTSFVNVHNFPQLISCDALLWTQMDKQSGKTKELIKNLVLSCGHKANKRLAVAKKTKELTLLYTQMDMRFLGVDEDKSVEDESSWLSTKMVKKSTRNM